MDRDEQDFHNRRTEQEARLALEASSPQAARAHTQLAALHSEQARSGRASTDRLTPAP